MMAATLMLVVLLCCVESGWMYLRIVGDKVVGWEEQKVVGLSPIQEKVWCVRCKDARRAEYSWTFEAFEVSRLSLSFSKGLVNLSARQHNGIQWA
jgi:hypothetical protein